MGKLVRFDSAPAMPNLFPAQRAKMSTAPQRERRSGKPSVLRQISSPKAAFCENSHRFQTLNHGKVRSRPSHTTEGTRITPENEEHRSSSRTGRHEFKTMADNRKVREWPRQVNIETRNCENYRESCRI